MARTDARAARGALLPRRACEAIRSPADALWDRGSAFDRWSSSCPRNREKFLPTRSSMSASDWRCFPPTVRTAAAQDPLKEIKASRSTASRTRQSPDRLTLRWRACVQERGMQMSAYGGRLFMVKAIFRASLEPGESKAPAIFSRRALARANPTQNQWDSTDRPLGVRERPEKFNVPEREQLFPAKLDNQAQGSPSPRIPRPKDPQAHARTRRCSHTSPQHRRRGHTKFWTADRYPGQIRP